MEEKDNNKKGARPSLDKDNKSKRERSFRLSNKKLFLTYPKIDLSLDSIWVSLNALLADYGIEEYLMCREKHKDGSNHVHCYFKLSKQFNTRVPSSLDVGGKHGRYEGVRNRNKVIEYILKDADIHDKEQLIGSPSLLSQLNQAGGLEKWDKAVIRLSKAGKIDEALALWEENKPKEFGLRHVSIRKSLNDLRLTAMGYKLKLDLRKFIIPKSLSVVFNKFKDDFINGRPTLTPIIIGGPGIGKTKLIEHFLHEGLGLSGKEILIVNNLDGMRGMNSGIKVIYLDDVNWNDARNREDLISILDSSGDTKTLAVKHGSVSIGPSTYRLVSTNFSLKNYDKLRRSWDGAVERRVVEVDVGNETLFQKKRPFKEIKSNGPMGNIDLVIAIDSEKREFYKDTPLEPYTNSVGLKSSSEVNLDDGNLDDDIENT